MTKELLDNPALDEPIEGVTETGSNKPPIDPSVYVRDDDLISGYE
jgi:hypothetical protein